MAACFMLAGLQGLSAQEKADSLSAPDSLMAMEEAPIRLNVDSIVKTKELKAPKDWSTWRPNPKRALWLALVIPGGGQIYNRKYWKLPLIYGGFMGCIYAMNWNNTMYKDYSQAYMDLMDSDPNTQSYNQFLHLGASITTAADKKRYEEIFRKRKDKYRRWRDLSFFVCPLGDRRLCRCGTLRVRHLEGPESEGGADDHQQRFVEQCARQLLSGFAV